MPDAVRGNQMPCGQRAERSGAAGDQHGAFGVKPAGVLRRGHARQPRHLGDAVTHPQLGFTAQHHGRQRGPVVEVGQDDTARMLGLSRAHQAPHGGGTEFGAVPGDHGEPGFRQRGLRQPGLEHVQCRVDRRPGIGVDGLVHQDFRVRGDDVIADRDRHHVDGLFHSGQWNRCPLDAEQGVDRQ